MTAQIQSSLWFEMDVMTGMAAIGFLIAGILPASASKNLGHEKPLPGDFPGQVQLPLLQPYMGQDLPFRCKEGILSCVPGIGPHDPLDFGRLVSGQFSDHRGRLQGPVAGMAPDPLLSQFVHI